MRRRSFALALRFASAILARLRDPELQVPIQAVGTFLLLLSRGL